MSIFSKIPINKPKRNGFNLSHERKLTCQMGKLVPILNMPVVPGDTAKVVSEAMIRMAPMIAPVMHRVNCYIHYFFVPNRLIWSEFQNFITGGEDGTAEPAVPHITLKQTKSLIQNQPVGYQHLFAHGSLWDYMCLPSGDDLPQYTTDDKEIPISLLPFKAYQLIYNEYYRDQNLQDEVEISKDVSGNDYSQQELIELLQIRNRCWEKDYFSSALPWPQRGEDVLLPLHGEAPLTWANGLDNEVQLAQIKLGSGTQASDLQFVISNSGGSVYNTNDPSANDVNFKPDVNTGVGGRYVGDLVSKGVNNQYGAVTEIGTSSQGTYTLPTNLPQRMAADLTQVTASTINELRRATAAQRYLELRARSGSRYIEVIEAEFGVRSSDARLQRPEYLGGGKTAVVISEVLQNSASDETTPQGNMAGHGISVGKTHKFKRFFEEHGYVIGIMSIVPKPTYQQGIPRDFLKMDRYDFYSPMFAHLGEQEIYNAEIYAKNTQPFGLFGYTPRYAEYKYIPSSVHGDFRGNMDFWHLGRIFNNAPTLNSDFVQVDESADDLSRIFAAMTDDDGQPYDHFWIYLYNQVKMVRPMPVFGIPKIV